MKAIIFLKECKAELEKVHWPSKDEVVKSTIIVLITVLAFSMFLFFSDYLFVRILSWFWSLRG